MQAPHVIISFLRKTFEGISPFCKATGSPVLDFWWCMPGFQARLDSSLGFLRFTSGATPVDFMAKMADHRWPPKPLHPVPPFCPSSKIADIRKWQAKYGCQSPALPKLKFWVLISGSDFHCSRGYNWSGAQSLALGKAVHEKSEILEVYVMFLVLHVIFSLICKILGSESFTRCFAGVQGCKEYKGVRGSCSKKTQLFVSAKILTNLITTGGL